MANILESPTNIEDEAFEEEINVEREDFELVVPENYDDLLGLPQINGVTLTGNKTSSDLGIITQEQVDNAIQTESQARSSADTELNNKINAESTARGEADTALSTRIDDEALARQQADNGLQTQIDAITSKSDVVDVVANYAALQAYDTSTLGNNDVVKVLDDETHEDALTYYRWSTTTQTWSYIGQEAPYYSKGQMDAKLAEKQDKLTAGANIQIQNGTISATDTTYTAGNGLNLNGTEFSADTDVLATKEDLEGYYTKPETDNLLAPKLEAEVVAELPTTGTEGKLYLTPKAHTTSTATGNPIEATVTEQAGQLESFQLDGDTFQQTYTGKNLYNAEAIPYVWRRAYSSTGEELSWTGYVGTDAYQPVEPNTQYALWNNKPGNTTYLCEYDENKNFIQRLIAVTTFTTTATTKYLRWSLSVGDGEIPPTQTQLELGSKTSYEPFVGGQPSPSPSYPQQIQTVTGEQTVKVNGKNMFNSVIEIGGIGAEGHGLNNSARFNSRTKIPVSGSTTYTLSATPKIEDATINIVVQTWDSSGQVIEQLPGLYFTEVPFTFTTPETCTKITISGRYSNDTVFGTVGDTTDYIQNVQLELGSNASSYTPFSSTDYPISLGSIELCKLGTYQDYIWKDGDDWKVHKATSFHQIESSSVGAWTNYSNIEYATMQKSQDYKGYETWDGADVISDHATFDRGSGLQWLDNADRVGKIIVNASVTNYWIGFVKGTSLNSMKSSLDGAKILYPLENPTDTTITDQTLIAQLEAIRTASLENGTNTITNTATGTNLAGDMEIGYFGFNPTNRYDKFIWLDINNNYEQIGGE